MSDVDNLIQYLSGEDKRENSDNEHEMMELLLSVAPKLLLPYQKSLDERILRCPFCGSDDVKIGNGLTDWGIIICGGCGVYVTSHDLQDAINKWNRRILCE